MSISHHHNASQLQRLAQKVEFGMLSSKDMILSKKQITKALISDYADAQLSWSAPLLFAYQEDRFSCIKAHTVQWLQCSKCYLENLFICMVKV